MSDNLKILDRDIIACGKVIDKDIQHFIAISYIACESKCCVANQLQCWTKWGYTVCDRVVDSVIAVMGSNVSQGKKEIGDE
ncbi:hypothetical protein N9045_01625 [bacterium]|nr:hypothetical protein [bacterium]